MDEATRSNYRYRISRYQNQINGLEDDRAALLRRIDKLEEGKFELDRLRGVIYSDMDAASASLSQMPNVTNLNAIQQLSPKAYEHYSLKWANDNLAALGKTMRAADEEIDDAREAIRNIDSSISRLYNNISGLRRQLSQ